HPIGIPTDPQTAPHRPLSGPYSPQPDQAGVLLDRVHAALLRHLVMPPSTAAPVAVTLWIAATHAQPATILVDEADTIFGPPRPHRPAAREPAHGPPVHEPAAGGAREPVREHPAPAQHPAAGPGQPATPPVPAAGPTPALRAS
ncbi:MAG: hypothetical protein ACRDRH_22260, partial [Pseudonocardia sp.]